MVKGMFSKSQGGACCRLLFRDRPGLRKGAVPPVVFGNDPGNEQLCGRIRVRRLFGGCSPLRIAWMKL